MGTIDTIDIPAIVTQAAQMVREQYLFADIGEQIAAVLERELDRGRYPADSTTAELARLVTGDLQSINGDKHLRLKYHEDEIPDLRDEAAEMAMFRQHVRDQMGGIRRVERLAGNIAVLQPADVLFPVDLTGASISAAMNLVATADALILDLRQVLGGSPSTTALLWGYLLDEPTHLNTMVARDAVTADQFWSAPWVPGDRFGGTKPLWALTSSHTFSGGEEIAYNVQQLGRGTVVGETTGGGAHARDGVSLHRHLELTIPVVAARNPVSGTNWEGVGVRPDVCVAATDALTTAHRLALEHLAEHNPATPALSREITQALRESG